MGWGYRAYGNVDTQIPDLVGQLGKQLSEACGEAADRAVIATLDHMINMAAENGGRITIIELVNFKTEILRLAEEEKRASNQDTPADGNRV